MLFEVLTLFPDSFPGPLAAGVTGRALGERHDRAPDPSPSGLHARPPSPGR